MITDSSSSSSNKPPEVSQDNDSFIQSQAYELYKQHSHTSNAKKRKKNNIILNAFEQEVNKKKTLPFDKENFELSLYNFNKKNKSFYNQAIINTKSKLKDITHKFNQVRVALPNFNNCGSRKPAFSTKTSRAIEDTSYAGAQKETPSLRINLAKPSRVYDESPLYKLKTFKPGDAYNDLSYQQNNALKSFKVGDVEDLSVKYSNHDSYLSSKLLSEVHASKNKNLNNLTTAGTLIKNNSQRDRINGIRTIMQFNFDDYSLPPSLKAIQTTGHLQTSRQPKLPNLN